MLILLTIIMTFPCLVRWSTESCWWPGCCSHQDNLDILRCNQESCTRLYKITCLLKITPRQRGFGHFVNSTSPWLTRKKCWFLHLNFQGIICLWADKMHCMCYVIWWAGGLQLAVITWQNMHRYASELYKFLEYGYWWRAAEGSTPIEAILSHLHSLVSNFLS